VQTMSWDTQKFNDSQLTQISDHDHEFEEDLFTAYKSEIHSHIELLTQALANESKTEEDHKTCERFAHDVKGASNNVGAVGVGAVGKELEDLCKQRRYDEACLLLPKVKQEYETMCLIWEQYKSTW